MDTTVSAMSPWFISECIRRRKRFVQRTHFVRQSLYSYLRATIGLSLAALTAGNKPARMPMQTLKLNATVMAVIVMTGSLPDGENELIEWTSPYEVTNPTSPPTTAITTLS